MIETLFNEIKSNVAAEVAECDSIDSARVREQMEKRLGIYESIKGFYVTANWDNDPMYLMQDYYIKHGGDKIYTWPVKTLSHSHGQMTLFLNKERAQKAIRDTEIRAKKLKLLPLAHIEICSTGIEKKVYHFLDNNSRIWLPTSDLIEICDELP